MSSWRSAVEIAWESDTGRRKRSSNFDSIRTKPKCMDAAAMSLGLHDSGIHAV